MTTASKNVFTFQVCSTVCPHAKNNEQVLKWRKENSVDDRIRGIVIRQRAQYERLDIFLHQENKTPISRDPSSTPHNREVLENDEIVQEVLFVRGRPVFVDTTNVLKVTPPQKACTEGNQYYFVNTTYPLKADLSIPALPPLHTSLERLSANYEQPPKPEVPWYVPTFSLEHRG